MTEYNGWKCFDEMQTGWILDKTCGSPLTGYEFINNGKSILRGGKRALLRVRQPQRQLCFDQVVSSKMEPTTHNPEPVKLDSPYPARTVNELARESFKLRLLNDIRCDLMICEIEGWGKLEYIREMQRLINSIGSSVLIEA